MGTERLAELFADDALYEGGAMAAQQLPTFISNHDMGRFGYFVRKAWPLATDDEVLRRVTLGYAMLMTLRGVPVIYYGDEQGFAGTGGDQDAREDMFASRTAAYNAERLVGTTATTAQSNFVAEHPLYKTLSALAALRTSNTALREGEQVVRAYARTPGIFAVSRLDPRSKSEVLMVFNTSSQAIETEVEVDPHSERFRALHGACAPASSAPGSYHVQVAALDYIVCTSAALP
jgi:glycosidase